MGNPEAGSSTHEQAQECDIQPQEYQYEATHDQNITIHQEFSMPTYEPSYYVEENQHNQSQTQPNEPQTQTPAGSQQQQPAQFPPPQANHTYGAQPARPAPFPPSIKQNNQTFSDGPYRQVTDPPQGPQTVPSLPVNFPTPSSQNAPMYLNQPLGYPSQGAQRMQPEAVNFPPQIQQRSPVYATGPKPMPAQTTPMVFSQTAAQAPPTIGYQISPAMQFQNNIGQQAHYGIPVSSSGLKPMQGNVGWSSSLFDCMNDPMNALITACFPCLTFGQIAEIVDEGQTTCGTSGILYGGIAFCIAMPCLLSCTYRTKLRSKFNLPEIPAPDWVTHFLCECCALCQEYRELQSRGWDPSIGWQGNVARSQIQQTTMMAPMNQRMMG